MLSRTESSLQALMGVFQKTMMRLRGSYIHARRSFSVFLGWQRHVTAGVSVRLQSALLFFIPLGTERVIVGISKEIKRLPKPAKC